MYMPFVISNSPAVFTRFIMVVLRLRIKSHDLIVYMDDIIIPSKVVEEGLEKLKKMLVVAEQNRLTDRCECQILKSRLEFLGYIIENS